MHRCEWLVVLLCSVFYHCNPRELRHHVQRPGAVKSGWAWLVYCGNLPLLFRRRCPNCECGRANLPKQRKRANRWREQFRGLAVLPLGCKCFNCLSVCKINYLIPHSLVSFVYQVAGTVSPTPSPSSSPSDQPTAGPSVSPSAKPTTGSPTASPSKKPTTGSPTDQPSAKPTTLAPSNKPTTGRPTAPPSTKPTT